jgi:hypothetical protein
MKERDVVTKSERIQTYQKLIESSVAASAQMLAIMIGDNPPEDRGGLWHYAHAALETAIRERLEQEPTPWPWGDVNPTTQERRSHAMGWKVLRRTTLDRFEAHKDFLQMTYDALVPMAQAGYAKEGRGWLMMPEADVLENLSRRPSKPGPFRLRGRLGYVGLSSLPPQQRPSAGDWVHTYTPQREMLIIIPIERPSGMAVYRLTMGVDADRAVETCGFSTTLSDGQ